MKPRLCIGALLFSTAHLLFPADEDGYARWAATQVKEALQQEHPITWDESALVVPTDEVATAIHLAVAGAAFGRVEIEKQRPFRAFRSGDYWVVIGTLPAGFVGGTAVTVIRASDGAILRVIHEQ